jgi:hypothetical protein
VPSSLDSPAAWARYSALLAWHRNAVHHIARWSSAGAAAGREFGLTLLGLWMIAVDAGNHSVRHRDLRRFFGDFGPSVTRPRIWAQMEAFMVGFNLLAVGLFARQPWLRPFCRHCFSS